MSTFKGAASGLRNAAFGVVNAAQSHVDEVIVAARVVVLSAAGEVIRAVDNLATVAIAQAFGLVRSLNEVTFSAARAALGTAIGFPTYEVPPEAEDEDNA